MRYQSNRPKRQFLAGVSCKQCGAMDKVVQVHLYEPRVDEYIECVACGYIERRPTADELPAIQNKSPKLETDEVVQVVQFRPSSGVLSK